ncbi:MAG: hypothetical protein ACJ762_14435 [Solirubrobacteraceae bacterium]
MPDIDPIHLALELSAWPDPISGHLSDSHGRARDFHGWLGLAAALEALAGTAAEEDPKG